MQKKNTNKNPNSKKRIVWWICLICFFIFLFCSSGLTSQYMNQSFSKWLIVVSLLVWLCSLIAAIILTVNFPKVKKVILTILHNRFGKTYSKWLQKNGLFNAVLSLICAIMPIIVWLLYFSKMNRDSNTDQSGWLIVIYYWTIGIPAFIVWLVCGIFGLKSKYRQIAIISLAVKFVSLVALALVLFLH